MRKRLLVTGGAGFIGSAVVREIIENTEHDVVVIDKLTYAGNLDSLGSVADDPRYRFVQADINDFSKVQGVLSTFQPDAIMHLAAESHVDRSIDGPGDFIQTNIVGTFSLLQAALEYWRNLSSTRKEAFRFHHVSTDEVFGSLGETGFFTETTPYQPTSPYSASKAASDHLVRAWHHTYGLPTVVSNCSNNYGPYHFPEKLIPLMIIKALAFEPLPVYGAGTNVRDWLYVEDHARALLTIALSGKSGATYCVGGRNEKTNLDVVHSVCALLDEIVPGDRRREELITFVSDRPGHDQRYAIATEKIAGDLGWRPQETFETGLRKTVIWYLANRPWWERIRSGVYRGERLGVVA